MLKLVCFAAVVASVCGQHQLYPGDPGYQPGYQAPAYQGAYQAPAYQGAYQAPAYQGPAAYQGGAPSQYQDQPITATNYRTDDGQQRSESRDNEGNVKGQYSYVDPNGKTITVKYTAGKNGFQVEGDHLPQAPQPLAQAPAGPASQGQYNAYQQAQSRSAQLFPGQPTAPRPVTQYQQPHYQRQPQSFEQEQQYQLQQQQQLQMQQVQQQQLLQQQQQQQQLQQLQQQEQQQRQQHSLQQLQPQSQQQYTPQQYQQPQQYYQPQQYQQPQAQQYQPLANFPGQSQHRFAAPNAAAQGANPSSGYNFQFNYQ